MQTRASERKQVFDLGFDLGIEGEEFLGDAVTRGRASQEEVSLEKDPLPSSRRIDWTEAKAWVKRSRAPILWLTTVDLVPCLL